MTFRKIDTFIWSDAWFESLSPRAKLAFIYLWTNETCNAAGMYEISSNRIEFELGYDIDTIYAELKPKVEWYHDQSLIWVKNFFKYQAQSSKFAIAALNSIKSYPDRLQMFIKYNAKILGGYKIDLSRYHIDTISSRTEQSRAEQFMQPG